MAIIPRVMARLVPPQRPRIPRVTNVIDRISQEMLAIDGLTQVTLDTVAMGPPPHVRVAARGWSPSLHPIRILLDVRVDLAREAHEIAADILDRIAPELDEQRRRSKAAYDLFGRIEPLDLGHAVDLDHLWIDVSLDPLCRVAGYTLREHLPAIIRRVHGPTVDHRGGPVHGTLAGFVAERERASADGGFVREAGVMIPFDGTEGVGCQDGRPPHPPFAYDGATLSIHAEPVPETVAALLVGRPLSDLVRLHPALDRRTIASIDQVEIGRHRITVKFTPELTPFKELAR